MSVRILVVEDDKHIRRILESLLANEPSLKARAPEVVLATDGEQGLKALDKGPYDLVITDLLMPRMDGFVFCRELRRHRFGAHVPVIVTSAIYKDASAQIRLRQEVGEHQFFAKPYEMRELVAAVHRILDGGKRPEPAPAARVETPESGSLTDRPPPRLLLDLAERKATGTLILLRGKVKKDIGFQSGILISCDSNLRTETLGNFLVSRGVIDEKQQQAALTRAQSRKELLGQALVDLGFINEKDLLHQLAAQMRAKVAGTLRWLDGEWSFVPGAPPPGLETPIEAPLLIFLGLKKTAHVDEIATRLAAARGRLSPTPRAERYRDTFARVFGLGALVALSRNPQLEELMAGTDPASMLAQLDALLVCGLAELVGGDADTRQAAPANDPMALSRLSHPPPPAPQPAGNLYDSLFGDEPSDVRALPLEKPAPDAEALRKEVLTEYLALPHRNLYEILSVSQDATQEALADAYATLHHRFRLERFEGVDLGADYVHVETLLQAFQRAFETLSTRRAEYDRSLTPPHARPPIDAELLATEAENLLLAGEAGPAHAKLAEAVAAAPDVAHHHARLGWATFLIGAGSDPRAAARAAWPHLEQALAIDPDDGDAQELAGRVLFAAGDDERAAPWLERALDAQPDRQEALAALEALYARQGAWKALERRYRKLIHRLGDGPLRSELWRRLGELYLLYLGDRDSALVAWEARFRAQAAAGEWDPAFVGAAVTQSKSKDAAEFYRRYRPRFLQRSAPLAEIPRHPDDDRQLGQVLERQLAAQPPAFSLADLGVSDDERIELLPSPFRRALGHVCALLGISEPPIYRRGDLGVEISPGAVDPPILLAGPQALANADLQQLAFRFGRACSFLLGGRAVALTLPLRPLAQLLKVSDATRFVRGMQRTADRLGLLACADPGVALPLATAPDELAAWALAESHLALRDALGISVAV